MLSVKAPDKKRLSDSDFEKIISMYPFLGKPNSDYGGRVFLSPRKRITIRSFQQVPFDKEIFAEKSYIEVEEIWKLKFRRAYILFDENGRHLNQVKIRHRRRESFTIQQTLTKLLPKICRWILRSDSKCTSVGSILKSSIEMMEIPEDYRIQIR
jgi:hypothetical protein